MPAAVAAWAAGTLAGLAQGTAAYAIVYAVAYVAAAYVIAVGAQKAFGRKSQQNLSGDLASRLASVKQPVVPRRIVYGRARVGGVIVYVHSQSVTDINTRGEGYVIPPAPYQVSTQYSVITPLSVRFSTYTVEGDTGEARVAYTAATEVVSSPATGEYTRAGNLYTFSAADAGRSVTIDYTANTTKLTDVYLHLIVVLAAHEVDAIESVYFDDVEVPLDASGAVTSGRYQNWAWVHKHLGATDQAADPHMVAASGGMWTENDRLRGHAYLHVMLLGHSTIYANGVPNITAVVRGRKDIYDPRSGTTGYSANAALCAAHYITLAGYGMGADVTTEIDSATLIAAANVCDEDVTLAAGGTEDRYTCNGVIDTAVAHEENLNALLSAMGGRAVWSMGKWYVSPAAYITPTVTLNESDARGNIKVMPVQSRREQFNAVKGVYAAESQLWQPVDYPPVTNATYQAQDGERIWRDLDLPFTTSPSTAQRLAKIELERQRQGLTCIFPARLDALVLQAGDTVMVSNSRLGWSAKTFEVLKWEFSTYEDDAGELALGVDLTLRETASAVFDWNSGLETTQDLAPNTGLAHPSVVAPPGGLTVTEELYETREGGGLKTRVFLSAAPGGDGRAHQFQFEYRRIDGSTTFTVLPPTRSERIELPDVAAGTYDFRVKAVSALGASSLYAQRRQEIFGFGARPADVTGLTLQAVSHLVVLQWTPHPDLDVRVGGRILIRHSELQSGATWEGSYSIVDAVQGNSTVAVVPVKSGTYLVKAEDAVGNQSATAATVTTRAGSIFTFSAAGSAIEDPSFTGTKTNLGADNAVLKLSGTGLWDTITSVDAVENVDDYGGVATSGTYAFANRIDLGAVTKVQLRMELAVETVQTANLMDARTGLVDSWADWDGSAAGGVGDCIVEVRETDDDPAGAPTWGAWNRLVTADYTARAFEFRALLSTQDVAYNIYVSKLRIGAFTVA